MAVPKVVIVGGGFGGLYCAQTLAGKPVDVTLIDRRNFHLFQPLLYQVATGALSPANIAAPLRGVLRRQRNAHTMLGEVVEFDVKARYVVLADGEKVPYDHLVVAAGSVNSYFGHNDWERHAPGLKTVEDATEIRSRVLAAFERAERTLDPGLRARELTFVIVGGGPTGVEMAGAISELARHTLRKDFRDIVPGSSRILLIEHNARVLPPFHPSLSERAKRDLQDMGVEVINQASVEDIQADHVMIKDHDGVLTRIETSTVVWGAGVKASPLSKKLADATGAPTDRGGRLMVEADQTVPGFREISVVGDMAHGKYPDGQSQLPGVAPVAMQQGAFVAKAILKRAAGSAVEAFRYWDKGNMATIGRARAVVDMYWLRFGGFIAWLAWLFIHLIYLVQFSNRLLVLMQWFGNYLTRNRSARLITEISQPETASLPRSTPAPVPTPASG